MNRPSSVQAILTDIEGTTTSLSFFRDTLFPYARRHLLDYVSVGQSRAPTFDDIDPFRPDEDHVDAQGPPSSRPGIDPAAS